MPDPGEVVEVYRNLHKGCFSLRQRGKVVAHAQRLLLTDVVFRVSEAGRQRVIREGRKNVHAYVKGRIVDLEEWASLRTFSLKVSYNPYQNAQFRTPGGDIMSATRVWLCMQEGIWALR